ncbi:MAG: hypothetical protein R3F48_12905 [Candidatus Zixiibacteriota bacterium]
MNRNHASTLLVLVSFLVLLSGALAAENTIAVNTALEINGRYIWRGMDIASTPSLQPTLSLSFGGFELGTWGAYTLSNEASESDEIDFWGAYTFGFENGASVTALATDYYFPNAGIDFFNFNNHDAVIDDTIPDPGAHTIEIGASFTGPESFPITISGFVNVYNDAGSNTYFQVDLPVKVNGTELTLFCGAAGGSEDNPDYYGTDKLSIINVGVSTVREIAVSESFSLPLSVSFIINPKAEISYLVAGFSF